MEEEEFHPIPATLRCSPLENALWQNLHSISRSIKQMVCRSRRGLAIVHVLNRRHAEEESFTDVGVSGIGARNKRGMVG